VATLLLANAIAAANPFWAAVMTMGASYIDQSLFGPKQPSVQGAKLDDLRLQCSTYGVPINTIYGTVRISGNVIWGTNFVEHKKTQKQGKGGGRATTSSYSYTVSCAIGLCDGEISGISRVWADGKEVTDRFWPQESSSINWTLYTGTETQEPDPFITAIETSRPTPAYRGLAYIVLKDLDVTDFGNRIPNFTFEVVRDGAFLDGIIKEASKKAGLNAALGSVDIDASDLAGIAVDGFTVSSDRTYRERVEQLMTVYNFGACETDGKVTFRRKEQCNTFYIPLEDLGAKEGDKGEDEIYQVERKHDQELPKALTVTYLSLDKDYQAGALTAIRVNCNSENAASLDINFCLTDARAKEMSEQKLYEAWIRRSTITAALGPTWAFLSPGDQLDLNLAGRRRLVQLTKTKLGATMVLKVEGTDVGGNTYKRIERAIDEEVKPSPVREPSSVTFEFLDISRLLTDTRTDHIVYIAATGNPYYSANVFETQDGGASWFLKTQVLSQGTIGQALTALAVGPTEYWDEGNSLTVWLASGTLESRPELDVLNGYNAAVIGSEIIQFRSATLVAANTYVLRGLLRGRLGTEEQVGSHTVGERFVLLEAGRIESMQASMAEWYAEKTYRVGPATKSVLDTVYREVTFTNTGRMFQPWSVCHVATSRDGAGNLTITWIRRDRNGAWLDNVDVPMSETSEMYEIDIMNESTIKRTLKVTAPNVTYTAADQIADFGTTQAFITVRIYQMSNIRGRGIGKEVIV